jgi:Tfp pilus assembly protein PilZ
MNVETALDAGMVAQSDVEHLRYATGSGRVLHSFNVADFYELHGQFMEEGWDHAGIVLGTQQRYSVGDRMRRLLRLRAERTAEQMTNRVVFLASV